MPLLNYTTTVAAEKSIGEIQRQLAQHGAKHIGVSYDQGQAEAVTFVIATEFGDRQFKLPARAQAVLETLQAQARRGKVPRRYAEIGQATRVAWRILKDWVEAQMAILESGMVAVDEVFLPYMIDGRGRTVYQVMCEQQLALPKLDKG